MPIPPPPCSGVGRHCRSLSVRLRIAELTDSESSADHEATWLYGHTAAIEFGPPDIDGPYLVADAVIHVPCRFAVHEPAGRIRCGAYGFSGPVPVRRRAPSKRQPAPGVFELIEGGKLVRRRLDPPARPHRSLPVAAVPNPCASARCRTADNTVGMACCRDLQVEIICPPTRKRLEALIRNRRVPYLCKVERETDDSLNVEMVSACSFLQPGVGCSLHGRVRPDGRTAKPDLCFGWPESKDNRHPGCVF